MKRRQFVASVLGGGLAGGGLVVPAIVAQDPAGQPQHDHERVDGPLANATVSFGAWPLGLDRMNPPPVGPAPNLHRLVPNLSKIQLGGTVNFIISGLHQVIVYGPGKAVEDVNANMTIPSAPGFPPLINDPTLRVYRGLNPALLVPVLDRVEAVQFTQNGLHLVICGVVPHFRDQMYGWVEVI